MVTLQDIADKTGYSRAVVSRALNPFPDQRVSPKALEIIRKTAQTMGYRRNQAASLLARGASPAIGVFLPANSNELINELITGVCNIANQHGFAYNIYFGMTQDDYLDFFNTVRSTRNAGVITYLPFNCDGGKLPANLANMLPEKCQVVVANARHEIAMSNVSSVIIDNFYGGKLAALHLLERGCKSFFCESASSSWQRMERQRGFTETIDQAGYAVEIFDSLLHNDVSEALLQSFDKVDSPPGIFCNTDLSALKIFAALSRSSRARQIGSRIKLCGFDKSAMAQAINLTSVNQPFRQLGETAMTLLVNQLTGAKLPIKTLRLQPELFYGQTT